MARNKLIIFILTAGLLLAQTPVNTRQINGATVSVNNGATDAGTQRVTISNDSTGKVGLNAGSNNIGKIDVLGNAGATLDAAPGSATPTNAVQTGNTDGTNLRVSYKDACDWSPWIYYPINVSSNTQVAAATASTYYLVCEILIPNQAGAVNFQLVEGTGSVCASNTAGLMGGTTAALGANIPANGGFIASYGGRAVAATATANHALCIFASASVNGVIAYVATTVAP